MICKPELYILPLCNKKERSFTMTTLELQTWKHKLAEEVLQTNDIDILKAIEDLMQHARHPLTSPCQYTVEELRAHVKKAMRDIELGNYQDIDEVLKEMETW